MSLAPASANLPGRALIALALLSAAAGCGDDLPVTPEEATFELVGTGRVTDRFTADIWVHGTHAYTGSVFLGNSRAIGNILYAWDISDPSAPRITDSVVVVANRVNDIKVNASGTVGVMTHESSADGLNGVTLLDLADPAHPTVITRYTAGLERGVHNVWIDGTTLYVAQDGPVGVGHLHIVDISTPAAPVTIAEYSNPAGFIHDVLVRDGLAFLSFWDAGLIILDVGNGMAGGSPGNPQEVSSILLDGQTHNAWYWPERALVFVGEEEFAGNAPAAPGILHVVDVSDLTQPRQIATYRTEVNSEPPHNFWMDEARGILYVAWYGEGLLALDVTGELSGQLERQPRLIAKAFPFGVGAQTGGTRVWAPQLHNGLIYVSDLNNGIAVLRPTF